MESENKFVSNTVVWNVENKLNTELGQLKNIMLNIQNSTVGASSDQEGVGAKIHFQNTSTMLWTVPDEIFIRSQGWIVNIWLY